MPTHWDLSVAEYLDQFCLSVSCAAVSSARQASLLRPSITAPRPAASQLVSTPSVGGPPERRFGTATRAAGAIPSVVLARSEGTSRAVGCRCPIGAFGSVPVADG